MVKKSLARLLACSMVVVVVDATPIYLLAAGIVLSITFSMLIVISLSYHFFFRALNRESDRYIIVRDLERTRKKYLNYLELCVPDKSRLILPENASYAKQHVFNYILTCALKYDYVPSNIYDWEILSEQSAYVRDFENNCKTNVDFYNYVDAKSREKLYDVMMYTLHAHFNRAMTIRLNLVLMCLYIILLMVAIILIGIGGSYVHEHYDSYASAIYCPDSLNSLKYTLPGQWLFLTVWFGTLTNVFNMGFFIYAVKGIVHVVYFHLFKQTFIDNARDIGAVLREDVNILDKEEDREDKGEYDDDNDIQLTVVDSHSLTCTNIVKNTTVNTSMPNKNR